MTSRDINQALSGNNVQVDSRFAEISNKLDINIATSNVVADPIVPETNMPYAICWHTNWTAIYNIDNGGSASTAFAEDVITRHQNAGVNNLRVPGTVNAEHHWIKRLLAEHGMQKAYVQANNSLYNSSSNTSLYHTGWSIGHPTYLFCPNYRQDEYVTLVNNYQTFLGTIEPDFIAIDQETFDEPGFHEAQDPGIVTSCSRCLSEDGFVNGTHAANGWRGMANDWKQIARDLNPNVKIFFYNSYDYTIHPSPNPGAGDPANWPGGVGDADAPRFYYIYPGYNAGYDTAIEALEQRYLQYAGNIEGSYPWISANVAANNLCNYPLIDEDTFYGVCRRLAQAGAHGFQLYPSPWSVDYAACHNIYSAYHLQLIDLLSVGIQAFSDYYGGWYRANPTTQV